MCYAMIDPARVRTLVLFRESHRVLPLILALNMPLNPLSENMVQAQVSSERE